MAMFPLQSILFWIAVTLVLRPHVADPRQGARRNVGLDEADVGLEFLH